MDLRVLRKEYKLPLCILQNAIKLSQHAAMTFSDDNQNNKEVDLQHFPADVETEAMLYERAGRFVDYLKEQYDGKQVLAVGHGLINRAVQAHIQGVTLEHLRSVPKMNNAELRRFKLT